MSVQRNMLFFCCPMESCGDLWRRCVLRLRKYIDQFDGVRTLCIVQGEGMEPVDVVLDTLGRPRLDHVLIGRNHPELFEADHWHRMLETVQQAPGITWFGHTKGITHGRDDPDFWAYQLWVETSFEMTLARPEEIEHILCDLGYLTTGPFMLRNPGKPWGPWCYSGTFYWFHNRAFERQWRIPITDRWCVETWPARISDYREAHCYACDDGHYLRLGKVWSSRMLEEVARWRDREWDPPAVMVVADSRPILNVVTPVSRPENLPAIQKALRDYLPSFQVQWYCVADSKYVKSRPEGLECHYYGESNGTRFGNGQRNKAIEEIDRGLVWFLDDDNLPHPEFDRCLTEMLQKHPGAPAYVFGQYDGDGQPIREAHPRNVRHGWIDTAQFVLRRKALGDLRFASELYAADWDLFERFWKKHGVSVKFGPFCTYYNALAEKPNAARSHRKP